MEVIAKKNGQETTSANTPEAIERIMRVNDPNEDKIAKCVAVWGILHKLER